MWRASIPRPAALLLLCLLSGRIAPLGAASLVDPRLGFHVISTTHFVIYFHQGEQTQAERLSVIAEEAWHQVPASLANPAPQRTHVILADQSELANGWATPLPRNIVFVSAAAPSGSEFIGRSDDWLRLVFTHEFTHIVHLDRSEGWARVFRGIFGRAGLVFPNLFLPSWQIEGLASFEESTIAGEGRLHAGDFRLIERAAARAGRLEPLDRINGGLTDWPGGLAVYAYGLGFHQYLADRFGTATLGQLASRTAGRLPFFSSRAFRRVFGESLGSLWAEYRRQLEGSTATEQPQSAIDTDVATSAVRITHDGHIVTGPRWLPACSGCPGEVVYSVRDPHGFPALRTITLDGSGSRRLTDRYYGSTVGVDTDVIVFDRMEWRRNTGLYSDLYALNRHTGQVHPLTRESRVEDPDLSPDGRTIVGVREVRGRRELVLVPLNRPTAPGPAPLVEMSAAEASAPAWTAGPMTTLISAADTQFNAPRWSPDGRSVVVARQRLGALSEVVIVGVPEGTVRVIASDPSARIVTPTWRPDGGAIVAAADYNEGVFDLYEFPTAAATAPPRRLTALPGGATWPEISADGRRLVFVGYTVDGFDLFTTSYPLGIEIAAALDVVLPHVEAIEATAPATAPAPARMVEGYSPRLTLLPTSWSPIVETGSNQLRAGVDIGASDVLARHFYSASATWLVAAPHDALTAEPAVPDWRLAYAYDRWRPTFFLGASSDTSFGAGPPDAAGRPTGATVRSLEFGGGVLYPVHHVRATHRALLSVIRTTDRYTFADRLDSRSRTGTRIGWSTNTAHTFGYSVSPEDGFLVGSTAELVGRTSPTAAAATTVTVDARGYFGGFAPHHVLALRAAAGWSGGETNNGRIFHLGGSGAGAEVIDFGRQAISLLRGFPADSFAGTRVGLVNLDYRFPIARPQRGVGTLPLLLHTVHAAVFTDVGHAWTQGFTRHELKTSVGAEVALDVVAGYSLPFTIAAGGAWGRDGASRVDRTTAYVRLGRGF